MIHNIADAASAIMVVSAEAAIPNPRPAIKIKSSSPFNIDANERNRIGVFESPTLRSADANVL